MNKEFSKQRQKMLLDSSDKTPHFGFRKLGIGLASMLLSTTLFLGGRTANVHADTVEASANESNVANESDADDFARPTTDASTSQTVQASANSSSASVQEEPTTNVQASTDQTVQASANTSNTTAQPDYSSQSAQPTTSNYSAPVQQNNSTTNTESNYYNSNNSTVNPAANYSDSASYQAPTAENTNTDQSTLYNNTAYDPTAYTDNTVNPAYNYASYQAQDNTNAVNTQKAINDINNDISKTDEAINKASEVSKLDHNVSDDVTKTVSNNIQDMSDNIDNAGLDVTEKNKHIQNADTDNGYQYQTFYLNNNNNDYNDDNDFSVSDDPIHAAALQLASKPLLSDIFNTSLVAVNSSTGTFDTDATHRADAPEGAVYVLDPENVTSGEVGPNGIYENPVTHAKIEGKMLWPDPSTLTITLWVQDASGKKSKRATTTVTVTYSRSMFFDKDGKFIGYGVKTDKDSDRPITINGYTLDEYISQRIAGDWKKRYKISDDSAKAIDDWVVTRGTPNKQLDITLVPTETKAVVKFYDITNNPNATGDNLGDSPLVATDTITGVYGTRINYDTNAKMKTTPSLQGYKLAGQDPFSNGFPKNLGEEPEYVILVKKVPQTTEGKVTRHINYDVPGETPPTPIDQPVNITKTGDKITPNGSYPSVKNPVIPGYHTDTPVVPKQTPGQDGVPLDKDTSVTVHYKKNGKIVPVDPDGHPIPNVPNPPYETDPNDPTKVTPDEPTPVIPGYIPDKKTVTPDNPDTDTNVPYHKIGKIVPIDKTTGDPIPGAKQPQYTPDPNDPNKVLPDEPVPDIPGYVPTTKTVTPDDPTKDTNVPYSKIGKIVPVDKDTGNPIPGAKQPHYTQDPNDPTKVEPNEPVPTVPGYIPTQSTVTPDDPAKDTNVPYSKIGKIVPVDKDTGDPIPDAKQPHYTQDPNDPTKVEPNEPVPTIPGYIPTQSTVTPDDPAKDTNVPYSKIGKIVPVDPDGNPIPGAKQPHYTQDPNDPTKVEPNEPVPTVPGYIPTQSTVTPDDPAKDTNVPYVKIGKIVPVDQQGNPIPTAKQPHYTQDPNDPTKVTPNEPVPDVKGYTPVKDQKTPGYDPNTNTVTPVDPGKDTNVVYKMDDNTAEMTRTLNVIIDYTYGKTDNYHKKGDKVADDTIMPPLRQTGTGTRDPKTGHLIPNNDWTPSVNTIKYDTDNFPKVEGYGWTTPSTEQKGNNYYIHVKYYPTDKQNVNVTINYVDEDDNNKVLGHENIKSQVGERFFNPKDDIKTYTDKGYALDQNNVPTRNYTKDDNGKTFTVTFKHGKTTVNPDNPGKPGEPINPNDPDGPKWPDGSDKDSLQKTGTQTITYTGAGDNTPPKNIMHTTFNHELVIDNVTGKVVADHGWTPGTYTFDTVTPPEVKGYHTTRQTVGGKTVTPDKPDATDTVEYVKNAPNSTATTVTFVDTTTGKPIDTKHFHGKPGDPINYTTKDNINDFIKKGYKVINDETKGQPLTFGEKDQKYVVTLGHQTENVTRNKSVTRHIKYVVPNGYTAPKDVIQILTFKDHGVKDLVTGKTAWASDKTPVIQTFAKVDSPEIKGTTPNMKQVDQKQLSLSSKNWDDQLNENIIVTYVANPNNDNIGKPDGNGNNHQEPNIDQATPNGDAEKTKPAKKTQTPVKRAPAQAPAKSAPSKQAQNNEPAKSNPIAPRTVQAATIDAPAKSAPAQAPAKSAPAEQSKSLPQTGEEPNSLAALAVGSLLLGMSAMGLYESKRKRKA